MNRTPNTRYPISSYPVPWASSLTELLGPIYFHVEQTEPQPTPHEWLGIVSSHTGKHGYTTQEWQNALQSALQLAHRQHWGVLIAQDAPYSPIILHACIRFSVPIRVIQTNSRSVKPAQSGFLKLEYEYAVSDTKNAHLPFHDCATVFLSDKLFVLALNEGGKIGQLLEQRLRCVGIPPGSSYLSISSNRSKKMKAVQIDDWLERGVIGWLNIETNTDADENFETITPNRGEATYQPFLSINMLATTRSKYFIHCTRSRRGPWPDQSIAQFHDELLHRPWRSQPTVLETLIRILQNRRLIATSALRRSSTATVCFSGNSIEDLLAMRRFRPHLARWDWEPYGIMIDRDWLIQQGAKQVSYIHREAIKTRSDEELAFCQVISDERSSTDWREEQEWRVAGDLRLSSVPFSKAIVFVATQTEAVELQRYSFWPIAIANPT